jgi:hypothetical protein
MLFLGRPLFTLAVAFTIAARQSSIDPSISSPDFCFCVTPGVDSTVHSYILKEREREDEDWRTDKGTFFPSRLALYQLSSLDGMYSHFFTNFGTLERVDP